MSARYEAKSLTGFCTQVFEAAGVSHEDAEAVSKNLVGANLRGIDSHGVMRVPAYVDRFAKGQIAAKSEPVVLSETAATALVDGRNGWGATVSRFAMGIAIKKAHEAGISAVGVRHSNHFGYAAEYGMMPLEHDMIGIALTNAPKDMAPWGARKPLLGTNPICICAPAKDERPYVYDGATSVVAHGKIQMAHKKHVSIPPTWAYDTMGRSTTDPKAALEAGMLMPMGTYKGSALSMAVDILSGVLPGGAFGGAIGALSLWGNSVNMGHFFAAIDIRAFGDVALFKSQMDKMIAEIRTLPLAEGVERLYIPGEIEFEFEVERSRDGIPVVDDVVSDLKAVGSKLGVKMPEPIA